MIVNMVVWTSGIFWLNRTYEGHLHTFALHLPSMACNDRLRAQSGSRHPPTCSPILEREGRISEQGGGSRTNNGWIPVIRHG
jgi:hypothetical protein